MRLWGQAVEDHVTMEHPGDVSSAVLWAHARMGWLGRAVANSAGQKVPVTEAQPKLYKQVWTDLGAMVWDGLAWKRPFVEGQGPSNTWDLKRTARKPKGRQPAWWLRE